VLEVKGLSKSFGAIPALDRLDLEVPAGELCVILGPSGSGKTTLLRLVAGLETPDAGSIAFGGEDWTALPPRARNVAMVFQHYTLYPHLSIRGNIEYPLRLRKIGREERRRKVERIAGMLGIARLLDRGPAEVSGGEARRIALARALVRDPSLFLLDEPLTDVDPQARFHARAEIRRLQRESKATSLYVTHDQEEAAALADRLVILVDGRPVQSGAPDEIYRLPEDVFVARFLGRPGMNILPGRIVDRVEGSARIILGDEGGGTAAGRIPVRAVLREGAAVQVGFRPESVRLTAAGGESLPGGLSIPCSVTAVEGLGSDLVAHVETASGSVLARCACRPAIGPARIAVAPEDVHLFDAATGKRIP
jgi:ABC-type sugar transport system ATPase subunit